jgi:hypothetical protein
MLIKILSSPIEYCVPSLPYFDSGVSSLILSPL